MKMENFDELFDTTVMDPMDAYVRDLGKVRLLTHAEEIELANKAHAGCIQSRDKLIRHNLRLVIDQAKRFQYMGLEFGDLVNEGNIGLMRAVEMYDPSKGWRFSTYAVYWIQQFLRRGLENYGRLIRLPSHASRAMYNINQFITSQEERPSDEAIAQHTGISVENVRLYLATVEPMASIDNQIGDEDGLSLSSVLEDDRPGPDEDIQEQQLARIMKACLKKLTDKQRLVMECRYGLNGKQEMTLDDVAALLNLSRERIRQIQRQGMKLMAEMLKAEKIEMADLV